MEQIDFLLDTDIGSDIDDAIALAYLLREPKCNLLGVTTVSGDVRKRASLASYLCHTAGKPEIPIRCGSVGPLAHGPGQPNVPQYEAIADYKHEKNFSDEHAIHFLRRIIRQNPGKITLLGIGPLTNIALLFGLDPEIPSLLKKLVLMAGAFTPVDQPWLKAGTVEWNLYVDPVAAQIVFHQKKIPSFVIYGLDVTHRCQMPAEEVARRFTASGKLMQEVLRLALVWFRERPSVVFHDPLAAASIFEPSLCEYQNGEVVITAEEGPKAGLSTFTKTTQPRHTIAENVFPDRFYSRFFEIVKDPAS
jgi:purine nucleosidase